MEKQFIYIVQAALEVSTCKIGRTNDLEQRLAAYNAMTGKSQANNFQYLFACEVSDMVQVENDIKKNYSHLREKKNREIYFYNDDLFEQYVAFLKAHPLFLREIEYKPHNSPPVEKIVKKTTPSLKQRGVSRKDLMQQAKKIQNDEFYTQYEDIEKEISMYDKEIWRDKVVFCNCDDAVDDEKDERKTSAFARYFLKHFSDLQLKKLICTHYNGGVDLFHAGTKGYVFTKDGFEELKTFHKGYSGSFDDPISLKILNEEADIVCTNPPFSKAKEYWKHLIASGQKFLIISNISIVLTAGWLPYFKEKKAWAGYNSVNEYLNPKQQRESAAGHWYTNLPINDRPKYKNLKIMPLSKIPDHCKAFDDAGMLVVRNGYIPSNYDHPFAVSNRPILNGLLEKGYEIVQDKEYDPYFDGKRHFAKVLVQKNDKNTN